MNPIGYADINYQGASVEFTGPALDLRDQNLNDMLSSMRVPAGMTVTLYADINRGGASIVLTADTSDFRTLRPGPGPDGSWNDCVSSVDPTGAAPAPGPTPAPSPAPAGSVRLKRGGLFVECAGGTIGAPGSFGGLTYVATPTDNGLVVLTKHDSPPNTFDALFVKANVQLSFQDDGSLQTRAAGTFGPWEQQQVFATTQPDGTNFLYRLDGTRMFGEALEIVEAGQ